MSLGSKLKASTDFIEVLSVGTALISTVLLVSPVQGVGYIGIGSGIGAFTASVLCKKKHLQVTEKHINGVTSQYSFELSAKDDEIIGQKTTINHLKTTVDSLRSNIKALEFNKDNQEAEVTKTQKYVDALLNQNQILRQDIEQVTNELDRLIDLARTTVDEALDVWKSKLSSLLRTKRELYPKLAERLDELLIKQSLSRNDEYCREHRRSSQPG